MAWPLMTVKASSPTFNYNGTVAWPDNKNIRDQWIAALNQIMETQKAAANSLINQGWTPTGDTHTGTAPPATPASIVGPYSYCGIDRRYFWFPAAMGAVDVHALYGARLTQEFRWVNDVPYIAPGTTMWGMEGTNQITDTQWDPGGVHATNWNNATAAAAAAFHGIYNTTQYPNFQALAQAVLIPFLQTQPGMSAGYGVYWRGFWYHIEFGYNGVGSWYSWANYSSYVPNRVYTYTDPGQQGQWHLESRFTNLEYNSTPCNKAYFECYDKAAPPDYPDKIKARVTIRVTNASKPGYGLGSVGNLCDTTFSSFGDFTDPNILDSILNSLYPGEGFTIEGAYHPAVETSFITPGGLINLQEGTPFLGYNELKGALVYDIQLEKWGKWKSDYSVIVPFTGLNSVSNVNFGYTDLGMNAGLLHADGFIYAFDHKPTDSWIRYGKMGYYRLGMIHFLEARVDFRTYATGSITIDSSLDGRNLDPAVKTTETYTDQLSWRMWPNMRARWFTITVSGNYDLQYMEVRGNISCRR